MTLRERLAVGTFLRTGHRGARGLAPENTLEGFERATREGVDVLELDVRLSADGRVVVLHDATVARTTDWNERSAAPGEVSRLTWEELKTLDAGHRFSPDGGESFPFRGRGVRIPLLAEVLSAFPEHLFTVELKEAPQAEFVARVADVVRPHAERVCLASFSHRLLRAARRTAPDLATSFSGREIRDAYLLSRLGLAGLLPARGVVYQAPLFANHDAGRGLRVVDRRFLAAAHRRGLPVTVWTINEPERMRELIALGVDGITTDRPDLLNEVLAERPLAR